MRGPTLFTLLILLLAGPALADPDVPPGWPEVIGDHVGPYAQGHWPVRVRNLDRIEWTYSTGVKMGMAVPGRDGLLRVMGGGGNVCCVDPDGGKHLWATGGNHRFWNYSGPALGPDDTAYGGNHTWISAVAANGEMKWRTGLRASWVHRPPALSPDAKTLYAGADNVGLVSLDAATGEINWLRRDFKSPWTLYAFDPEGRLVAGFKDRVVCFEMNGREAWEIQGAVSTLMTVGNLLVASRGDTLFALYLDSREHRFSVGLDAKIHGTALGDDGRIVVTLADGGMAQVALTGHLRWKRKISNARLSRPVTALGGESVVMDLLGCVYLVDSNGLVVNSIQTGASFFRWRPSIGPDGRVYVNHDDKVVCIGGGERPPPKPVRATSLLVVADDFVVDVWVNGRVLPLSSRQRLAEVFGTMTERIHVDLREGDYIVFNVVANRMRWGGASYFGVHATDDDGRLAFVSTTKGGWFACDDPSKVAAFIEDRDAGRDEQAVAVSPARPWNDAKSRWHGQLGCDFTGEPVWGGSANTWIKHVVGPVPDTAE